MERPRRRRDTVLYYGTVAAVFLQVLITLYPEICSSNALLDAIRTGVLTTLHR